MRKLFLSLLLSIFFASTTFAASIPSISHLDRDIQSSIDYQCSNAKINQGPVKYIACLNKQLSELNSTLDNYQKAEVRTQLEQPSNKDTKLSDAVKAIENGESYNVS